MSTPLERLAEIRAREERAHDEVVRICRPGQNWRMTIPADRERDSDLIITKSLQDVPRLAALAEDMLALANGYQEVTVPGRLVHDDAFREVASDIRALATKHLVGDR